MLEHFYDYPSVYFNETERDMNDLNGPIYEAISELSERENVKITLVHYLSAKFSRGESFFSLFDIQCEETRIQNICASYLKNQHLVALSLHKVYQGNTSLVNVYISFRTLDIADLTTDGTFTLGAAVSAVFTVQGQPLLGVVLAFICGALAGFVTALLQTKLGVQPILAGIITMTALYSVNLMVMGKPNINFFKEKTIFTAAEAMPGGFGSLLQAAAITAVLCVLLVLFLRTQLGLSLRATGDNRDMVSASSINPAFTTTVGLCLSNAVVALSGALIAQYQKFADNTLGTGMVVIGLASLIIGEVLFGRGGPHALAKGVLAATVGAVVYRIIVAAAIAVNIDAKNMKLVSALIVAAAISYPAIRDKVLFYRKRREANRNV